jgi:hypothetical protein
VLVDHGLVRRRLLLPQPRQFLPQQVHLV